MRHEWKVLMERSASFFKSGVVETKDIGVVYTSDRGMQYVLRDTC